MITARHFPKEIRDGDILLSKISLSNDENILKKILVLHKSNKEHLSYWHYGLKELLFSTVDDIKKYIKKTRSICYAVYYFNKVTGHIEIIRHSKLENEVDLAYFIDKNNVRKGIMPGCLTLLENVILAQGINLKVSVGSDNAPSLNLMKKLGYEIIPAIHWAITEEGKTTCQYYEFQKTPNIGTSRI